MHDATTIQMGTTKSSNREVSNHVGSIPAGKVVRLKSDDTLSLATADGSTIGVSLGKDQSGTGHTAICRKGEGVPVLLTAAFEPDIGDQVAISDTTGLACAYTGSGDSYVNAIYTSEKLSALDEVGAAVADGAAYIDFVGGL